MRRGRGKSVATVDRELQYCRAAFERAGIEPNPFRKFDRFSEAERTRYLNETEMRALFSAARKSPMKALPDIIQMAILTGLRKQMILRFYRDQIDFSNGSIRLSVK